MNILITGASGYIGSNLLKLLKHNKINNIVALVRKKYERKNK